MTYIYTLRASGYVCGVWIWSRVSRLATVTLRSSEKNNTEHTGSCVLCSDLNEVMVTLPDTTPKPVNLNQDPGHEKQTSISYLELDWLLCDVSHPGDIGGSVEGEPSLRSSKILLSRVRTPPLAP
ncbi:hypothetical protein PoB_004969000 [Plakobranchus ocellatus]|uniref:Uncharacterized protein n=1 Tax=Plakobranchus ocellatus TaxID=259542 RepID=A0AAV4BRK5_9GAST|nr:hypothetical protein PoB_004969000 [Plakobranchus ocellatus]